MLDCAIKTLSANFNLSMLQRNETPGEEEMQCNSVPVAFIKGKDFAEGFPWQQTE